MRASSPSRYVLLDGVRGVAAIAIMYRHMGLFGVPALPLSYLGVDLFFLLSGAVIAHAYEDKLCNGMGLRAFMQRRMVRLYPMILLGLVLGVINAAFGDGASLTAPLWVAALTALVFLPDNPAMSYGSINGPAWSLSYEFAVNAAYALGIKRLTLRALVAICAISGAVLVVAALYKGHLDTGYTRKSIPFGLGRVGFSFFAGVILYRLHHAGRLAALAPLRGRIGAALAVALVAAALLTPVPPAWRATSALAAVFLAFPAVVAIGLESSLGPRLGRVCEALGAVSYPLYLIHFPLSMLSASFLIRHGLRSELGIAALLFGPAMVVLAWLLDRWFDAPVRKWISQNLSKRRRAVAANAY